MHIRELRVGEIALLKALRLLALNSYEVTCEQPVDYWLKTAESLTGNSIQRMFIVEDEVAPSARTAYVERVWGRGLTPVA